MNLVMDGTISSFNLMNVSHIVSEDPIKFCKFLLDFVKSNSFLLIAHCYILNHCHLVAQFHWALFIVPNLMKFYLIGGMNPPNKI